jgi:hypothetical protein
MGNYISKLFEDEENNSNEAENTEPIFLQPINPKKKQRKNKTKRRKSRENINDLF